MVLFLSVRNIMLYTLRVSKPTWPRGHDMIQSPELGKLLRLEYTTWEPLLTASKKYKFYIRTVLEKKMDIMNDYKFDRKPNWIFPSSAVHIQIWRSSNDSSFAVSNFNFCKLKWGNIFKTLLVGENGGKFCVRIGSWSRRRKKKKVNLLPL